MIVDGKHYRILVQMHPSGLWSATSPDMRNLLVHGHSWEQLGERIPVVIRELIKAAEGIVEAPWTPEQVKALNDYQRLGYMHPFTCGNDHEARRVLVASELGWRCPDCDYTRTWAHDFMADASLHPPAPPLSDSEDAR